jgi:chromatin remodeling complex protein RSC6
MAKTPPATSTPKTSKAAAPAQEAPPAGGAKIAPPKPGAAPNALQKPLTPSPELAAIVGASPIARGEVVSKVWTYIKDKNLQNPENKREILADPALHKVFGKDKVTMFEMNKHLARHLT